MNSVINDAIRYIYIERRTYFFIVVQLTLSIALVTYSLSHVTSARLAIENADNSIQKGRVNIEAYPNNENASSFVLSNAEIDSLRVITDGAFHYTAYCTTAYALGDDVTNVFLMIMDEDELSKDVVYVSDKVISSLSGDVVFFNDNISVENGTLYYCGRPYKVRPMPEAISRRSIITTIDGESISMEDVLLFSYYSKNVYDDFCKEDHIITSFSLDDDELSDIRNKEIGFIVNGNYWQDFHCYTFEPFEQVSERWLDELFVQAEFTLKDGGKLISFYTKKYAENWTDVLLWITGSGEKYYKHLSSVAALGLESQGDKKIEHGIKYKDYKTEMREKSDSENER